MTAIFGIHGITRKACVSLFLRPLEGLTCSLGLSFITSIAGMAQYPLLLFPEPAIALHESLSMQHIPRLPCSFPMTLATLCSTNLVPDYTIGGILIGRKSDKGPTLNF
jgi:hypothetical protein